MLIYDFNSAAMAAITLFAEMKEGLHWTLVTGQLHGLGVAGSGAM